MAEVVDVETIAGTSPDLKAALVEGELPTADLEYPGRQFFRVTVGGLTVGYGGLEVYGPDALLRSVVVPAGQRGLGNGRVLAEAVLAQARRQGVRQAYLFTTSAVDFFTHLGFRIVERTEAPDTIRTTRQATKSCATASMLTKVL